jgi:glutamate dehydrogenase/leucine dehydrogenase
MMKALRCCLNGVQAVVEGANMPSTDSAIRAFREAGVLFGPGKAGIDYVDAANRAGFRKVATPCWPMA